MTIKLPNGGTFAIATGYGSAIDLDSLSNANPCVVGAVGHGLSNGDILEITSGWPKLNNQIVRVSASSTDTFSLEGIDTTSVSDYPAGGGVGSAREVTAFAALSQVLNTATSGGEQQYTTYQLLEGDEEEEIATVKSARRLTITLADDPTLPGYIEATKANNDRLPRAIKFVFPSAGGSIYYNGRVSVTESPTMTQNEVMSVVATIALRGRATRYNT